MEVNFSHWMRSNYLFYPGSKPFRAAYQKALTTEREQVGASRTIPLSMKALAIAWRASSQFKGLTAASQKTYNRLIESFLEWHGHKATATPYSGNTGKHERAIHPPRRMLCVMCCARCFSTHLNTAGGRIIRLRISRC